MTPVRSLRIAPPLAFAFAVALVALAPSRAQAQDRRVETAAKEALKRAQGEYAAGAYDKAIARLQRAIRACGTIRCSPTTRASLLRDRGVMQLKSGDGSGAEASFADALRADPRLETNPAYDAPDVRAEWDAARDEASLEKARQPSGDFVTTPVAAQTVRTPIPIYVEYEGSSPLTSVVVKYEPPGAHEFHKVTLARIGKGWGGTIPCGDVRRGVLRYYVQGFDASGEPVALSGDPKRPFFVRVRHTIAGPPPTLPGSAPPAQCSAAEAGGAAAATEPPPEEHEESPFTQEETGGDESSAGTSATGERPYARWWLGVTGAFDVLPLSAADDVCKLTPQALPANAAGYYCTRPDGSDYPTRATSAENDALGPGNAGHAAGGIAAGDVRVLVAIDYALGPSFLLGARAGLVFHRYPGQAAGGDSRAFSSPVHLELRGTFVIGDRPLARSGFAPTLFFGGGVASFDASTNVSVTQTGVPGILPMKAWRTAGPGFVAVGGGARYGFSPRAAFVADLRFAGAFGGGGFLPSVAPELTFQYGF